jgi:hypothetical protein
MFIILLNFLVLSWCNAQQTGADVSVMRIENGKIISGKTPSIDEAHKSFTDKIRILRVSEGEWDVFFETQGGPFSIPQKEVEHVGTYHEVFKKAYEDRTPIQVTVNTEKEQVLSINPTNPQESAKSRNPASQVLPGNISPDQGKTLESVFGKHFGNPN